METAIKTSRTFFVFVAVLLALGSTADTQGATSGYEEIDWKRLVDLIEVKKLFVEEMTKYMIKLKKQRDSRGCGTARHEMDQSLSSITSNLISEIAGTTAVLQDSSRALREEMGRETCPGGPHTPCANAEDWRCKTGECIPKTLRCDASRDCLDGSDETPSCSVLQCVRKDSFKCAFIDLCIPVDSRCNNIWECPDGSDENNCEFTCTQTQFLCARDRVCVPLGWQCDDHRDCSDGSDEAGCGQLPHPVQERMLQVSPTPASPLTIPTTSTLHSTESPCDSGLVFCSKDNTCIPRVWLCDGAPDCTDGSDEADCQAAVGIRAMPPVLARSTPPTLSTAVENPCGSGLVFCSTDNACLPRAWLCDGFPDCSDESDEADCQVAAGPQDEPVFDDPAPRIPPTSPPLAPPTSPPPTPPTSLHTEGKSPCDSGLAFCRKDNTCFPRAWLCDGSPDCTDGSDEDDCQAPPTAPLAKTLVFIPPTPTTSPPTTVVTCEGLMFRCLTTSKCIPSQWRCDGDNDCEDASDEVNCSVKTPSSLQVISPPPATQEDELPAQVRCGADKFRCDSGDQCISSLWRCDKYRDCSDGSDESDCVVVSSTTAPTPAETPATTPETGCPVGMFQCQDPLSCIPSDWKCDGQNDCAAGTDELNCNQLTCPVNNLKCSTLDICFPRSWLCDGIVDCPDASDESSCPSTDIPFFFPATPPTPPTLPQTTTSRFPSFIPQPTPPSPLSTFHPLTFPVKLPTSFPFPYHFPPSPPTLPPFRIHVTSSTFPVTSAISSLPPHSTTASWPLYLSDKKHTHPTTSHPASFLSINPPKAQCEDNMFQCSSSARCLWPIFVCDGFNHCEDGSDEDSCSRLVEKACRADQYRCVDSGTCIMRQYLCDGFFDCPDDSDEKGCHNNPRPQRPSTGTAVTTTTILPPFTNITQSVPVIAGLCVPELGQFLCARGDACLPASVVCDNRPDCSDGSDEGPACGAPCPSSACNHGCFVTPSGHQCTCPLNFFLLDDVTCKEGPPAAFLLVTQDSRLEALSLDGSRSFTIVANSGAEMRGVSYDPVEESACWSEGERGAVYCQRLRGNASPHLIVNEPLDRYEGLAVDWMGRNVYVTDSVNGRVRACSLSPAPGSTSTCTTILSKLDSPRAIQLDLSERMMYLTSGDESPLIHRAGMNGSGYKQVVPRYDFPVSRPSALAVDSQGHYLYWVDDDTQVERLSYDGEYYPVGATLETVRIHDMTLWQEKLYWTDNLRQQVMTCTKNNCGDAQPLQAFADPISPNSWIALHHPDIYKGVMNPCGYASCSHLCLLSPEAAFGFVCACPDHLALGEDFITCRSNSNFRETYTFLG